MHFFQSLTAIAATSLHLVAAAPANQDLVLIKTSEAEPARWVSVEEKDRLVSEDVHLFDITDIKDPEVLEILSTPPSELESRLRARQVVKYPTELSHQARANCLIGRVKTDGPKVWLKDMTDFWNRHYRSTNGTIAAQWMFDLVKEVAAPNPAIEVTQFVHSRFNQPSTIVRIPGETDDLVIVGAHFDSTGSRGDPAARAPGADDDGSGVVVILEALRIFAQARYKPYNTIEFHFYAGEEGGLIGSGDIFANYKAKQASVLGFVNQDMTGYSPSGLISIFTDYVDTSLTAYVRLIAEEYSGLPTTADRCGYACSDHGSAYNNGFPAAYVCDEVIRTSSPYIHSARDTYETIMWDAIHRHAVFTVGFLVEASYLNKDT